MAKRRYSRKRRASKRVGSRRVSKAKSRARKSRARKSRKGVKKSMKCVVPTGASKCTIVCKFNRR